MDPVGLGELLAKLSGNPDPDLLVGYHTSDDAGVYKLTEELAIVTTADFITPPVNDGRIFGRIAAANALSDVYAMGGKPLTCLNLVAFPSKKLPAETLHQIVIGAMDKITEAGAVLAGGHSIDDDEPKFGLAVTGVVHPGEIWTNAGAKSGDALILTKPVGSGVLFNANLKKWVSSEAMEACIETLCALNKSAAEVSRGFEIHAMTDVTGFGLAGHGLEMARASGVQFQIDVSRVPVMDESLEMYKRGVRTGVNRDNRRLAAPRLRFDGKLPDWHEEIVFDPQTSGGLLAALPEEQAKPFVGALHASGVPDAVIIGRVKTVENGIHLVFQ